MMLIRALVFLLAGCSAGSWTTSPIEEAPIIIIEHQEIRFEMPLGLNKQPED